MQVSDGCVHLSTDNRTVCPKKCACATTLRIHFHNHGQFVRSQQVEQYLEAVCSGMVSGFYACVRNSRHPCSFATRVQTWQEVFRMFEYASGLTLLTFIIDIFVAFACVCIWLWFVYRFTSSDFPPKVALSQSHS
ncbi:hypothetical protein AAHC03_05487 [Spirometra sp. Aus1]